MDLTRLARDGGAAELERTPRYAAVQGGFFIFMFFKNIFFTEIYFRFHILQFYTPTARQGGGRGRGGMDLYINKNKFILCRGPWREPAAPLPGGRPPAANWWGGRGPAARQGGGRLPPQI